MVLGKRRRVYSTGSSAAAKERKRSAPFQSATNRPSFYVQPSGVSLGPALMRRKLTYTERTPINPGAPAVGILEFRLSSIYDPYVGAGGR